MKLLSKKIVNRLFAILLAAFLICFDLSSVFSVSDVYAISTTDDYFELVKKCRVDFRKELKTPLGVSCQ